ncbi:hypothetical protein QCN27_03845 [Cereibacter sp. SYSU M97828]|nr:hypothetical protein [Cereibacter flavus]
MERVTRAQAAQELNLNKSTITRWVQQHPALIDDNGLVDLEELREHRDTVVNPKLQTRSRGAAAPAVSKGQQLGNLLNDSRTRNETAKAIGAELDLAERLKMTLRRRDVEASIAAAGEVMKQGAAALAKDRAEAMARITDVRTMERALEDLMRELLAAGADALADAVRVEDEADAA